MKKWMRWPLVLAIAILLEAAVFHVGYGLPWNAYRVVAILLIYLAGGFLFRLQRTPDYFK